MAETTIDHDRLLTLEGKVVNIEKRINGHVPDRCIRTDEMLQQITKDISEIKSGITWLWRTVGAAAISAIIAMIFTRLL